MSSRVDGRKLYMALVLAGLVGCSAKAPKTARTEAPRPIARATLRHVVGKVLVKRAAGDDWIAVQKPTQVYPNDKVRTAAGASVLVVFGNGSSVTLGGNALIGISQPPLAPGRDPTDLTLLRGKLDAELDHSATQALSVATPTATVRAGREIVFQ